MSYPYPYDYWLQRPLHYQYQHNQSAWAPDIPQQYRVNPSSAVPFPDTYPESSQRTILTPSPQYSPSAAPTHYKNDLPRSPSLSPDYSTNSWGDVYDDSSESSHQPSTSTPFLSHSPLPPTTSVKEEPDENAGRFIMELSAPQVQSTFLSQSLAPPTEVPLRATQAPPEMRSMMGVFRLNPFTMHSGEGRGSVAPTWCGEEAHPLDEEPIIFEFQLELDDNVAQVLDQPKESLRSFSPDFELHQERDEGDQSDWREYHSDSAYTSTPSTWELEYPTNEEQFSSSEPSSAAHLQPSSRPSSRLYEISQHYLRKDVGHTPEYSTDTPAALCYPSSSSNSSMVSAINTAHRMRPPEALASWPRPGGPASYVPASRSTMYATDSPGCHFDVLPSITSANRRWSLPDSNSNYHAPFLG